MFPFSKNVNLFQLFSEFQEYPVSIFFVDPKYVHTFEFVHSLKKYSCFANFVQSFENMFPFLKIDQ